jgi:phosphonate transport system permease protein
MRAVGPARDARWMALVVVLATALAWVAGEYDLSSMAGPQAVTRGLERGGAFLRALGQPDLSPAFLARATDLSLSTLAMAVLGTALGIAGGLLLGTLSSRNAMVAEEPGRPPRLRAVLCECARLVQDALRGVPDFAWAVIAIPLLGLGSLAGVAALAVSTAGILGRNYSEVFDTVPERLLEPLRAGGATRLQAFLYGVWPAALPAVVSLSLLRWECAVRNSAVIGVVGGGGLGSEVSLRMNYGEYGRLMTLLLCLLVLTVGSDLVSGVVRGRMRVVSGPAARSRAAHRGTFRRRALYLAPALALIAWSVWRLSPGLDGLLAAERWAEMGHRFGDLLRPDIRVLGGALASAAVPLSMAWLGTLLASTLAAVLTFGASRTFQVQAMSFTGDAPSTAESATRQACLVSARGVAAVTRAIPEVFWAILLVSFFHLGTLPGMLALAVHSTGILARVFAESVDALPARTLEVVHAASGSRLRTFLYGAVPAVAPEWLAYTFYQFESNVRAGVVLGIVGVGGLGFLFSFEFEFFRLQRAATYLLVMVAVAVLLDRLSRHLGLARGRFPE